MTTYALHNMAACAFNNSMIYHYTEAERLIVTHQVKENSSVLQGVTFKDNEDPSISLCHSLGFTDIQKWLHPNITGKMITSSGGLS